MRKKSKQETTVTPPQWPLEEKALPRKDFRDAYLFKDEHGVEWSEDSYRLPDGSGETFGPGHPNRPAMLDEVKTRTHKPSAEQPPKTA